jgi:DNA-binding NarL/FixJ family response regulator
LDISLLIVDRSPEFADALREALSDSAPNWSVAHVPRASDVEMVAATEQFDAAVVAVTGDAGEALQTLESLCTLQPDCLRLVLADIHTLDATQELVSLCHRVLVVPCDAVTLRLTIEHTRRLQDTLGRSGVRALGLRRRLKDSRRPTGDLLSTV